VAKLTPKKFNLTDDERTKVQQLSDRHNTPQQIALRARIIIMASDSQNPREIARSLDPSSVTKRPKKIKIHSH